MLACSSPSFQVPPALASVPAVPVEGHRSLRTGCEKGNATAAQTLTKGLHASIGDMRTEVVGIHRDVKTERQFGETVLRDIADYLMSIQDTELARAAEAELAKLSGALDVETGVAEADQPLEEGKQAVAEGQQAVAEGKQALKEVGRFVSVLRRLLEIPRSETETMTTVLMSRRADRKVISVCVSTDTVALGGYFDRPQFDMSCRITTDADGADDADDAMSDFTVTAGGSWANVTYAGELRAAVGDKKERAAFTSQSMKVMGVGEVRGFELRQGNQPLAAISFYETAADSGPDKPSYKTMVWRLPRGGPEWQDAVTHVLTLASLFPWPNACDAPQRRQQSFDKWLGK